MPLPTPRDVHALIPRIFEYVTLHSKKNFADIVKLKSLRWGDYQELSHGPNVIKNFLLNERARQENQSQKKLLMEAEFRVQY